ARTVIAIAGDHGESLGEHGELTHGLLLYQATLRVPLIVVAPGVLAPRVVREPGGLVRPGVLAPRVVRARGGLADLAPTLAALLAQPLPPPRDGRDLSAALLSGAD